MNTNRPLDIDIIILSSLDPKSIVSYIRHNKDTYKRCFNDRFWISLDHHTFQDVFSYIASYGFYDLMRRMISNPYHTMDDFFLREIQIYMAYNNDKEGLEIITSKLGNKDIYNFNVKETVNDVIERMKTVGAMLIFICYKKRREG